MNTKHHLNHTWLPVTLIILASFLLSTNRISAQPLNDDPCGAQSIGIYDGCYNEYYSNIGSTLTSSSEAPNPSCGSYSSSDGDVWLRFVMPPSGSVQFTMSGVNIDLSWDESKDMGAAVYSGANCNSLSQTTCYYNIFGAPDFTANGTPGNTYWLRVWYFELPSSGEGMFRICADGGSGATAVPSTPPTPTCGGSVIPADSCHNAMQISASEGHCASTASFTDGGSGEPSSANNLFCGSIENSSFLTFIAADTTATLHVYLSGCSGDFQARIFKVTNCTNFVPVSNCIETSTGPAYLFASGLLPGEEYHVYMDGYTGSSCDYRIYPTSGVAVDCGGGDDAPEALCQSDTLFLDGTGSALLSANSIDSGSSSGCGIDTLLLSNSSFNCSDIGSNIITLTLVDSSTNSASCQANVLVIDSTTPQITCFTDTSISASPGNCTAIFVYSNPGSTDNCSGEILTRFEGLASGSAFPVGINLIVFAATDSSGNADSCSVQVTVIDDQAPLINCPSNIAVNNDAGECSAVVTYLTPNGTDNCSGATTTQTTGLGSGATYPIGSTTETYRVTDATGLTNSCSFDIMVSDNEPPVAICQDLTAALDGNGSITVSAIQINNNSSDNCGIASLILSPTTFDCNQVGDNTVSLLVADNSTNTVSCSATVTVTNTNNLLISCPADTSLTSDSGLCSAVLTYPAVTVSSNCGGIIVSQIAGLSSGSGFPQGSTVNRFTAIDISGATNSCEFTVDVSDQEKPLLICQADTVLPTAPGSCVEVYDFPLPVASDNCAIESVTQFAGLTSGTSFTRGIHVIEFLAIDSSGNSDSCSVQVIVKDFELPTISCPPDTILSLDSGLCTKTFSYSTPTIADNCPSPMLTRLSGQASGTAYSTGQTVHIFEVADISANTTTCSFTVSVFDNSPPVARCTNIALSATGSDTIFVDPLFVNNSSEDPCGIQSLDVFPNYFTCENLGSSNRIELTVTDNNANSNTCTANATVILRDVTINGNQKISKTEGKFSGSLNKADFFGSSLAYIGDLNGDGNNDVVVGAFKDNNGGSNRGALWVLFLDRDNKVRSYQKISSTQGNFNGRLGNNDWFGASVAFLGDMNGDGIGDLISGCPNDDDGGNNRGAAYILHMNNDGTVSDHVKLSHNNPLLTLRNAEQFGAAVANIGDLNGDGYPEVAIGSPLSDAGGNNKGSIRILYMNANSTPDAVVHLTGADFPLGIDPLSNNDLFGSAIAGLGDLDGDNVPDIAVSAIKDDDQASGAGAVYILLMNADGSIKASSKISNASSGFTGTLEIADQFGFSLTSGADFNNDGVQDLLVGTNRSNAGGADKGAIWLLMLNPDGRVIQNLRVSDLHPDFAGNLDKYDRFGSAVSVVKTNTCETIIAAGASNDDDGGSNRGAIYILELGSGPDARIAQNSSTPGNRIKIGASKTAIYSKDVQVKLFPNPNTGIFRLQFEEGADAISGLAATSLMGKRLLPVKTSSSDTQVTYHFDLSGEPLGVYYIHFQLDGKRIVQKVLVLN